MLELLTISSLLLWALCIINLLLTFAIIRRIGMPSAGPRSGPALGRPAPAFSATTQRGEQVSLAQFAGRPLILMCTHET